MHHRRLHSRLPFSASVSIFCSSWLVPPQPTPLPGAPIWVDCQPGPLPPFFLPLKERNPLDKGCHWIRTGAVSMKNWVQMWKSVSARTWLKRSGRTGPFWQEDYFDRYLRSAENYSEKWAYVETNPVRAGLVARPEEWAYRGRIHALSF